MKVLFLVTRAERGGAQVHVLDLLANLPQRFKPVLVTGEGGFLCDEAACLGVEVRIVPQMTQPMNPFKDLVALFAIMRVIREEAPAMIHAHTSKAGLLGRLAGKLTGRPVVFTAHTWSFADGISRRQQWLAIPLERLVAAAGAKIISVSAANTGMALRRSIAPDSQIVTIWNGVPDVPFRATPGLSDVVTLIMVARFAGQKDQMLLLDALAGVDANWRLRFVGDGPTRAEAEQAAARLSLTKRVEFLGDRDDSPQLLANADAFVLSTKWEGLPLSILEAMRAGLAVIATDVGGVSEAVTDGLTGYLTRPGDVSHLREKIRHLTSSRQLLRSMGEAGRRRYEQDFRIESMMQKTLAVYRDAVSGRAPSPLVESVESWEA